MKFVADNSNSATTGMYTKTKDCNDDGEISTITIRTYIGGNTYGSPLYLKLKKSAGS
ncbi:hypothetical protein K5V07_11265 [Flavobacterium sp. CHNK8]|uniref:hypothetical protein n=1 Tax=Flavobacterium sp. CHNK8 TaxID=2871165 RepID=UPI001C8E58B3|nr:hypothetical protein [Flavobacterium sp. CHNK8]QZK91038.1 hypothetical protein K5V07_11265 [Flavobacterium sp. CHNK8]